MARAEQVYYKKNVVYNVGVRRYPGDSDGVLLTGADPFVAVDVDDLRDFKRANRRALTEGLIIAAEEPNVDWDTENVLSDDEIEILVKNYLSLKNRLPKLDSLPMLYKILETAKNQDRAKRIVNMIQSRIDELEEDENFITREEMLGVE